MLTYRDTVLLITVAVGVGLLGLNRAAVISHARDRLRADRPDFVSVSSFSNRYCGTFVTRASETGEVPDEAFYLDGDTLFTQSHPGPKGEAARRDGEECERSRQNRTGSILDIPLLPLFGRLGSPTPAPPPALVFR